METVAFELSLQEKLNILADAAKYDVACTSSGSSRRGRKGHLGNTVSAGICHSFASDGRCISLLKILFTNECIFDCKYCLNRSSNDQPRATFTPEEICTLVTEFYRRNYIEGLFLSSGIVKSPTYTMEQMYQAIYLLRTKYRFNGYIHVKAIPGAPEELITQMGYLADRMSVNLELPTTEGLAKLAPHKKPENLVRPLRHIQDHITRHRLAIGKDPQMERSNGNRYLPHTIFKENPYQRLSAAKMPLLSSAASLPSADPSVPFVPAGQSTQMIIGATGENDLQLLSTTQKLYQMYDLKRVFFSAYVPLNEDAALPALGTAPPLLREHRLYQADWLLRYYGFHAEELLSPDKPNFNILLDPKCDWALRHLEYFPMEINKASYADLLRVPGIGTKSASRIVKSRRGSLLDFPHLKKIGVVLKRAKYFITCNGKMMHRIPIEEDFITQQLICTDSKKNWEIDHPQTYRQLSLFDDFHFQAETTIEDTQKTIWGQL
ncbi:MAG TPA: putative DNA modification/repair radical SAM protein [Candidatus Anaerostipes excrementavium]|uniref:DNA modification/repair radical SAM protein n=1 Tax=Candidatus Anaerostipes excrementavium TaxID=2838463 RepID=A0A9D1WXD5_9FIRM|nr:putative DNA modification/repair radical SAM protein [uncultured Anaerostipes sp.]HIX68566.1 putative DNA modification/repair radical SAM protein [Candidatus Anaerostipes excrementavium]